MKKWFLWAYVGIGVLTLIFQIYVRFPVCVGAASCSLSFAKGLVWSVIWPIIWLLYYRGMS
jgi:hypothetical protein